LIVTFVIGFILAVIGEIWPRLVDTPILLKDNVRLLWDKKSVFTCLEHPSSTERDGDDKKWFAATFRQIGRHSSPLEPDAPLF